MHVRLFDLSHTGKPHVDNPGLPSHPFRPLDGQDLVIPLPPRRLRVSRGFDSRRGRCHNVRSTTTGGQIQMQVVLLTADTDCDGTSYGAHRITVPDTMDLTYGPDVLRYAQDTGQMASYYDVVMGVDDLISFRGIYFPRMTVRDRAYFNLHGYTSSHMTPSWNPWVYDDTIGIPALDSRYDD